jgi:hypothetical protein
LSGKDFAGEGAKFGGVQTVEITRTLVKSPPELWAELEQEGLARALEGAAVRPTEPERELRFSADGASGTVRLEPSSWGTKVVVSAEIEEQVAARGFFARLRGGRPAGPSHEEIERRLHGLLDALGQAHRKPFTRG